MIRSAMVVAMMGTCFDASAARACAGMLAPDAPPRQDQRLARALRSLEDAPDEAARRPAVNAMLAVWRETAAPGRLTRQRTRAYDRAWAIAADRPPSARWPYLYLLAAMTNQALPPLDHVADPAVERGVIDALAEGWTIRYDPATVNVDVRRSTAEAPPAGVGVILSLSLGTEAAYAPHAGRLEWPTPDWLNQNQDALVTVYREFDRGRRSPLEIARGHVDLTRLRRRPTHVEFMLPARIGELLFVEVTVGERVIGRAFINGAALKRGQS